MPHETEALAEPPLILVEGFMCAASSVVWGDFQNELQRGDEMWLENRRRAKGHAHQPGNSSISDESHTPKPRRRIIFASIGPLSSLHDRACELFYSLRGGRVDYGAEHAQTHGHGQFGRDCGKGKYPEWGEVNPSTGRVYNAHFMGHSLGGPTIYKLQQLLRNGFFDHALGKQSKAGDDNELLRRRKDAMILSILAVQSPFRGTPIVHLLGEEPLPQPVVRRFSAGDLIAKGAHLITFLNRDWLPKSIKSRLPDLFSDSWPFATRTTRQPRKHLLLHLLSPISLLQTIHAEVSTLLTQWKKSDWAEGRDCAPWDCTVYERIRMEEGDDGVGWGLPDQGQGKTASDRTWYCSIAAYMTQETSQGGKYRAPLTLSGSLIPSMFSYTAAWLARFDYGTIPKLLGAASEKCEPDRLAHQEACGEEWQSADANSHAVFRAPSPQSSSSDGCCCDIPHHVMKESHFSDIANTVSRSSTIA